jgi:hypothetical protein
LFRTKVGNKPLTEPTFQVFTLTRGPAGFLTVLPLSQNAVPSLEFQPLEEFAL